MSYYTNLIHMHVNLAKYKIISQNLSVLNKNQIDANIKIYLYLLHASINYNTTEVIKLLWT